ncbi:hypothetical protein PQE72_gp050 [Bacillus phage vB_BanS_Skywalker]|uniref:Uncharacterized protein n=2 Tax=Tsamsavirus TaxID=3044849 RepID=A0AAE8YWV7_9CAUD|nr:hypothetical protein PQE72_gp050 [Bacillus phage vB_BanS_Skywalker]YP_010680918.1 hypothetical protein PQE73_gp022 [Bacillus phage vB_BanS_MrDarsey]UGO47854.1 hypothetical protein MRDARSEY_22 [Bacillus phage vB_BanS_MrDarsey]UGO51393.1 hypothetical protein SKYWALKER_236 [Bacillus phage vB_BanS_Skywalker]
MNLQLLIEKLNNDLTARFRGVKFDNIGKLHNEIIGLTNQILQDNNTGLEINYCWDIHIKGEYHKVMKYNIDYTADKRYKYDVRGKVHFIVFSALKEMPEDATVADLIHSMQLDSAKENLERMQKERLEILEDLAVNKEGIESLTKKVKELESSQ